MKMNERDMTKTMTKLLILSKVVFQFETLGSAMYKTLLMFHLDVRAGHTMQ